MNEQWQVGEIPAITDCGRIAIAGWVRGHFGLDFRIWENAICDDYQKGWCLTHIPTGRVAMAIFAPLHRAQELADEFSLLGDWSFSENEDAKSLSVVARGFRNTHGSAVAFRSPCYSPLWPLETYSAGDPL